MVALVLIDVAVSLPIDTLTLSLDLTCRDGACDSPVFLWNVLALAAVDLILLWPGLAACVKRRHDRGRSGRGVAAGWTIVTVGVAFFPLWIEASQVLLPKAEPWLPESGPLADLMSTPWLLAAPFGALVLVLAGLVLLLGLTPGAAERNRYGPPPGSRPEPLEAVFS